MTAWIYAVWRFPHTDADDETAATALYERVSASMPFGSECRFVSNPVPALADLPRPSDVVEDEDEDGDGWRPDERVPVYAVVISDWPDLRHPPTFYSEFEAEAFVAACGRDDKERRIEKRFVDRARRCAGCGRHVTASDDPDDPDAMRYCQSCFYAGSHHRDVFSGLLKRLGEVGDAGVIHTGGGCFCLIVNEPAPGERIATLTAASDAVLPDTEDGPWTLVLSDSEEAWAEWDEALVTVHDDVPGDRLVDVIRDAWAKPAPTNVQVVCGSGFTTVSRGALVVFDPTGRDLDDCLEIGRVVAVRDDGAMVRSNSDRSSTVSVRSVRTVLERS